MPALTILADDLSGAADCGVQAARRGMRTVVRLAPPASGAGRPVPGHETALAWDLDTRCCDARTAFARTRAAARGVDPGERLFLKLDSSLRGHLGAALDAAIDARDAPLALVAPAFPAQGRTTIDGRHRVRDVDPVDLAGLLSAQSRHPVATLRLDAIRAGDAATTIAGLDGPEPRIVACDAEHDEDLRRLVRELAGPFPAALWAGSAGLATALVEHLASDLRGTRARVPEVGDGPVLVVAGSAAAETRTQVGSLIADRAVGDVALSATAFVAPGEPAEAETARAAGALASHLTAGRDALLHLVGPQHPFAGSRIARGLGAIVAGAAAAAAPSGFVLTGGETARAVCEAIGIDELELLGEIEPGIPLSIGVPAAVSPPRACAFVTKAGAFGRPESLVFARETLHGSTRCLVP